MSVLTRSKARSAWARAARAAARLADHGVCLAGGFREPGRDGRRYASGGQFPGGTQNLQRAGSVAGVQVDVADHAEAVGAHGRVVGLVRDGQGEAAVAACLFVALLVDGQPGGELRGVADRA